MFNEYVILHTPQPSSLGDGLLDGSLGGRLGKCSEKTTQTSDGNIWQVSLPNNIGGHGSSPQSLQQLSTANLPHSQHSVPVTVNMRGGTATDCSDLNLSEAMTCQELLAFSVAFSAALPTGHMTLESFYNSLARQQGSGTSDGTVANNNNNNNQANLASNGHNHDDNNNGGGGGSVVVIGGPTKAHLNSSSNNNNNNFESINGNKGVSGGTSNNNVALLPLSSSGPHHTVLPTNEDFSCCYELYHGTMATDSGADTQRKQKSKFTITIVMIYHFVSKILGCMQRHVKRLVEHKYFQQGILLAILINTLSMGIEYHNQPPELTVIVETSNIVFSAIFAVEMLLKIVAEGPFRYIANGFNVFDGVIVILR